MTLGKSIKGLAGLAALVSALTLSPDAAKAQTPGFPPVPVWGVTKNTPKVQGNLPGIRGDTIYLGTIDQAAGSKLVVPTDRQYSKFIVVNPNEAYDVSFAGMQPEKNISFEHLPGQSRQASVYDANTILGSAGRNDQIMVLQGQINKASQYCATDCTRPLQLVVPNPGSVIIMEQVIKEGKQPTVLPLAPAPIPPPAPPVVVPPPPVIQAPPKETWGFGWVAGGPMGIIGSGFDDRYCPPCLTNGEPEHYYTRTHDLKGIGGWAAAAIKNPIVSIHALAEGAKGEYKLAGEDCLITDPNMTYSRIEGVGIVGILGSEDMRIGAGLSGHRMAINRGDDLGNRGDLEQGFAVNAGAYTKQVTGSVFYSPSYEFRSNLNGMDVKGSALGARVDIDVPLSERSNLYVMGSAAKLSADGTGRNTEIDSNGNFGFGEEIEVDASGHRLAAEAHVGFGITKGLQLTVGAGAYSRKLGDDGFSNNLSYITPKVGLRFNF